MIHQIAQARGLIIAAIEVEGLEGHAVAREEGLHVLNRGIPVGTDQLDHAVLEFELPASARGKHRDNMIRKLGHAAHQIEHVLTRNLDDPRVHCRSHWKKMRPRVEK